jgi:hypothetical protein
MTPKPQFNDEYHKEQRKKMMESRGLSQNQKDVLTYLCKGNAIKIQNKQVEAIGESYPFRIQRNTVLSLHRRKLIELQSMTNPDADYYQITDFGKESLESIKEKEG